MRRLSGDLDYPTRLAYAAAIREGFAARQGGGESPYASDSADGIAWRYGYTWAARRSTLVDKGTPSHVRPRDVFAPMPSRPASRPRPRLLYEMGGQSRIAIGRRGESADSLRMELVAAYGLVWAIEIPQVDDAMAEYVARGGNYRPYARKLGMRDTTFLTKACDPVEVERVVVLSDRQIERVWRLHPVYESHDEDALIGDPGEWADEMLSEVTIGDPGGEAEKPAPLPMAVAKADGRGKSSLYFGHALDFGGGHRWNIAAFDTPLRVALGGRLNRELGFGQSSHVDESLPYSGDGFHWGRSNPMAERAALGRDVGPVCRVLEHPVPEGRWYGWLSTVFNVPDTIKWEPWLRRQAIYDRERNKSKLGSETVSTESP